MCFGASNQVVLVILLLFSGIAGGRHFLGHRNRLHGMGHHSSSLVVVDLSPVQELWKGGTRLTRVVAIRGLRRAGHAREVLGDVMLQLER